MLLNGANINLSPVKGDRLVRYRFLGLLQVGKVGQQGRSSNGLMDCAFPDFPTT